MARLFLPALLLLVVAVPTPAQQRPRVREARAMVHGWFQRYLNREPGVYSETFVEQLRAGTDPNEVLSFILGSQEYYQNAGATAPRFVRHLYRDLAGRAPTRQELVYWEGEVIRQSLQNVAYALLTRFPQNWDDTAPAWKNQYEYRRPTQRYR